MESNSKKAKKDTRWDKIRKKYSNTSVNITSDNVKKFLDLDFIGTNEMKILNGAELKSTINPAVVMDIRHNSIRNRENTNEFVTTVRTESEHNVIQGHKQEFHNQSLERVVIDNEIKKFQGELKKFQRIGTNRVSNKNIQINNKVIYENILKFQITTRDFYQTCIKAPLLSADAIDCNQQTMDARLIENQSEICRTVRFEENTEFVDADNRAVICLNSLYELDSDASETLTGTDDDASHESSSVADKSSTVLSDFSPDDENSLIPSSGGTEKSSSGLSDFLPNDRNSLIEEPKLEVDDIDCRVEDKHQDLLVISRIDLSGANNQSQPLALPEATERDQIIEKLFDEKFYQSTREYELKVLRKYFQKWIVMTSFSKISGKCLSNNENRVNKINEFLNKIRDEKKKVFKVDQQMSEMRSGAATGPKVKQKSYIDPITLSKKYQHKMKCQQDIIELQKAKLERQERMLTELKLSKMFDESKFSKNEVKTELNHVLKHGTVKLRAKAKCLQIAGNFKSASDEAVTSDEFKNLQVTSNEMPKFLAKMQARALERHLKHEEARVKRERLEKEKEEAKIAQEESKRLEDEQAKKERLEALREKRRQERLLKIKKEKEREQFLLNLKKANEFHRLKLLSKSLERFRKLVEAKRLKEAHAKSFRKRLIQKNSFSAWHNLTRHVWEKKRQVADQFYVRYLVRFTFRSWKKQLLIAQSKHLVAVDLYEFRLAEKMIKHWNIVAKKNKLIEQHKMLQAESHYNWNLKWKVIERWQRLHTIIKIERETSERRQKWRIKIWELLPDYQPNPDAI